MSMFFKGMTTRGAMVGGFLGLISSVTMVIGSKSVWETTFGFEKGSAWFPYDNPALFSMTLAFAGIYIFSKLDASRTAAAERERPIRPTHPLGDRHRHRQGGCPLSLRHRGRLPIGRPSLPAGHCPPFS